MIVLLSVLPVVGVLMLLFGMGATLVYLNRRDKFNANRDALTAIDDTWRAIGGRLEAMQNSIALLTKVPRGTSPNARVYAVLLSRGLEARLTAVPAQTFEEMVELVTKEYGLGWLISASCYVDLILPVEKGTVVKPPEPLAREEQKPSVFIQSLSYCRDAFAETPFERRALMSVINRIKKKYANDPPTA